MSNLSLKNQDILKRTASIKGFFSRPVSFACLILAMLLTGCADSLNPAQGLSGHILIAGSTALQPLVQAAADLFKKHYPHAQVEVVGGGSLFGLQVVASSKADIGDSDVYADPAAYPDPNLTDHIVCVVPFTMIVGPGVTINSLTTSQIIDIYSTRKILNWSEVGGPDLPIRPIVRPATSGTRATFRKYILGGRDENGILTHSDSSTDVRDTVANAPGAIGYIALSVLDTKSHPIAINGEMASLSSIQSKQYAFWSYEHMYAMGDKNKLANAFLDFMLTPEVQQLAQKLHYIPITSIHFKA